MKTIRIFQEPVVSFYPLPYPANEKRVDWRFETYEVLFMAHTADSLIFEKKIYWIGIIDLSKIIDKETRYPLSYVYINSAGQCALAVDQFFPREVDGKPENELRPYLYDMYQIHGVLTQEKEKGSKYYHILIEESVNRRGEHVVALLHNQDKVLGIPTMKPWIEEPVKDWIGFANITLNESKLQREVLLSEKDYTWQN